MVADFENKVNPKLFISYSNIKEVPGPTVQKLNYFTWLKHDLVILTETESKQTIPVHEFTISDYSHQLTKR